MILNTQKDVSISDTLLYSGFNRNLSVSTVVFVFSGSTFGFYLLALFLPFSGESKAQ